MRKLLIVLLALGAIAGFTAGFVRLFCHHGPNAFGAHGFERKARLEQRVADLCVEAAERRLRAQAPSPAPAQ